MAKRPKSQKTRFLPDGVADKLQLRAIELAGILLIALALMNLAAIVSYRTTDPSLNQATSGPVKNMLNWPGAYFADLMLQSIGVAILLLVPIFLAWGWRLVKDHSLNAAWIRVSLTPIMLLLATITLATISPSDSWPFNAGLGGFSGQLILNKLVNLTSVNILTYLMVGGFISTVFLLLYVMGVSLQEWIVTGRKIFGAGRKASDAVKHVGQVGDALKERVTGAKQEPNLKSVRVKRRDKTQSTPEARPTKDDRVEARNKKLKAGSRAAAEKQKSLLPEDGQYHLPPLDLLEEADAKSAIKHNENALEQNARMLEGVLEDFGVKGEIIKVRPGPVVTLYELEPAPGTKTSRVIGLADDIARSMSAISVRIATVPGRSVIGIELPNSSREMVGFRELLESSDYDNAKAKLPMVLGKDIGGAPEIVDLATMPHLLIAGTTGSGKSVGLNAMILSLLYKLTPDQCRFIMIDPKMLELSVYDDIPHLLAPVVTDPKKAVVALKWTVREMEDRYRAMSKLSVRNIDGYNKRMIEAAKKGEEITRKIQTGFDPETGKPIIEEQPLNLTPLPYIVVVVDEMADLMLVAGKEIEASIQRLAQMARAAGIHIIMATQRPSVDVITGTIKANFPTRISFMVTSKIDSRTILGQQGAEQLLGMGDMLHMAGGGRITRIHGPFVDDPEVEAVCEFLKAQSMPEYINAVTDEMDMTGGFDTDVSGATAAFGIESTGDELYDRAVQLVATEGKASTSFIQRHLQIGYNRAARIIEQMEKEGVVSTANHVGKRDVLVGDQSA